MVFDFLVVEALDVLSLHFGLRLGLLGNDEPSVFFLQKFIRRHLFFVVPLIDVEFLFFRG